MEKYTITGANNGAWYVSETKHATTLIGAKRQETILRQHYNSVKIWQYCPETVNYVEHWAEIDRNGNSLGDMRESNNF